jgi:hypothetical protein
MDRAQIELVANKLLTVLRTVSPQANVVGVGVDSLILLFQAGVELNALLKRIREETPETADAVLAAVIADYTRASEGWDAQANKEKTDGR